MVFATKVNIIHEKGVRVMWAERSIFEQAALASGLLSEEHLDRARRVLAGNGASADVATDQPTDVQIGQQLVDMGYLNRWQVGQLLQGYTKFTLGSYKILDAIGKGGMGYVFKGEHALLGRVEAIKVLPRDQSTPASIAKFCHEIRALARLDHPNLVRLTYADRDGNTYFLVTEYVPGSNLRRLVRSHGPLNRQTAAMIISQAAEGLQHAHEQGLVHRDVKPGNLMVTPDGLTKLTDLGLASFSTDITDESTDLSASANASDAKAKHIVGTPDYLAPEVIITPAEVRAVSDIYSLGCTLYYAVTGKVPFPGGETSDKLRRHLEEMPLMPQRINAELDDAFVAVLADMMRKSPEQRIPTAAEVIERFRPWTESLDPDLLQEIGTLAQSPGGGLESGSSAADTTPAATDQLETRHDATPVSKPKTAKISLVSQTANLQESPTADSAGTSQQADGLGRVTVVLLAVALLVLSGVAVVLLSG